MYGWSLQILCHIQMEMKKADWEGRGGETHCMVASILLCAVPTVQIQEYVFRIFLSKIKKIAKVLYV